MAKHKVSGPGKATRGSTRQTKVEPAQVDKKKQTKQKEKPGAKVKDGNRSSVQEEELELAPDEVVQNGSGRRRGRSAKLQAVKKMATMQEDIKTADDNDEDVASLDLEYDDGDDDDDEEDEDDFEATLATRKRANTRQKTPPRGKLKSQDKNQQPEEVLTAQVKQVTKNAEERYLCQASQEQFLSLSESDSSSEDEDIGVSSKSKQSSKPVSDQSKTVNSTVIAPDKPKSMETRKEPTGSSPKVPTDSAPKSLFDDLDDIPDLEGSQPGKVARCTQSLFDDVDRESDHEEVNSCEVETDAKPVATSQYFAKDKPRIPNHDSLKKGEMPKEKTKGNNARVNVKSASSDKSGKEEIDESDFEESPPPKKAKKQVKKKTTRRTKDSTKIKEETKEEPNKKDDTNALPVISNKRGRVKSQSTTSNTSAIQTDSKRKGEERAKKDDTINPAPATSKKRGRVKSQSTKSDTSVVKTESGRRGGKGGQPDVKDGIESPAKKRKLSVRMKKLSADAVQKAGRGKTKVKMEARMDAHPEMEVDVKKEEDAEMSSDDSHSDWEEVDDTPMNELGEPMMTPTKKETKAEEMSLEIDIDLPGTSNAGKKKKREYNWANYFQWQVNKYNKERQLQLHKAHLVLLLASGFHSNNVCNKMELQCLALSTISAEILSKKPKLLNINYLTKVLSWFKNCFKIRSDLAEDMVSSLDRILPSMFERRQAASERELVHMFAIIMRCLGADVRLIFSLQPMTFKAKKLTKKFKKENAKGPVKKQPSQRSTPEQKTMQPKYSSSCSDIPSPSKSAQPPSKSSMNTPKTKATSSHPKTPSSTSRLLPSKLPSGKSSTRTPKTNATSSNPKTSPLRSSLSPGKLSPIKSSTTTPKTQSISTKPQTTLTKSSQLPSKSSSSKSSVTTVKKGSTSSNSKTPSSKLGLSPSKLSSGKSPTSTPKTESTKTKTTLTKSSQLPNKSSLSKSSVLAPKKGSTTSSKSGELPRKPSSSVLKTQLTVSTPKSPPSKSSQLPTKSLSNSLSSTASTTKATSLNPKTPSSKAVRGTGQGKAPSGKTLKEQKTAPKKTPSSNVRNKTSESSGFKDRGEKRQIATSGRQPQKRTLRAKNTTRRRNASKMTGSYEEEDEDGDSDDDHSDYEEELRRSASKRKSRMLPSKESFKKKTKMVSSASSIEEVSSDSDFEEVRVMSVTKQPKKTEAKKDGTKKKASRKMVSSDSEESFMLVDILDPGSDCWLEVYLSSEKRWMCVDCVRTLINKPEMCEKKATKPITYVIGVENDGCVKDITRRYASKWMTETHKLRPVEEWWEETLKPYMSYKERDQKEDSDVQSNLTSKPLPTSVSEYKNHPLYALKRHLLKFESLYPESAAIIGYCRGEAVYSRECVHTLHTRETWMKEGKAIRIGEKPYKMVKPRPKWKKGVGMIKTEEANLGIFGVWQIEDYIPPPAVDGKVPRNEYGNVELFKPTMLPAGTVHLKMPGLNKIARKLDIDCAPAMMGWDFHSGYIHPVMDGFIVCEEHVEVLVAAWEEDRVEREKKEKEKREARAMGHWKLFIKSLLIRERLKVRYGKNDPNSGSAGTSHQSEEGGRKDTSPVKASWPENKMTAFTGDEGNLLPFEKKSKTKKKKR